MAFVKRSRMILVLFAVLGMAGAVLGLAVIGGGTGSGIVIATGADADADDIACAAPRGGTERFASTKLIFEYNSTDNDTGVHGLFDTTGWSELCVYDPSGRQILAVKPQGQLKDLTMGGVFFESREPPDDEISQEEILAEFPEGRYKVLGTSHEGTRLIGTAWLTHDILAAPNVTSPAEGDVVDPTDLVITWDPVTQTVSGDAVEISGYEVIVTNEMVEDRHGFSQPILSAHVVPSVTSLTIPSEFLEPGTKYELEVIALEESGNQTITVLFFETQ